MIDFYKKTQEIIARRTVKEGVEALAETAKKAGRSGDRVEYLGLIRNEVNARLEEEARIFMSAMLGKDETSL